MKKIILVIFWILLGTLSLFKFYFFLILSMIDHSFLFLIPIYFALTGVSIWQILRLWDSN